MRAKRIAIAAVLAIVSLGGINAHPCRAAKVDRVQEMVDNYRLIAKDENGRPLRHHKLRTARRNQITLQKLHSPYHVHYRVVIKKPDCTYEETNFEPAAKWEIVRE